MNEYTSLSNDFENCPKSDPYLNQSLPYIPGE